MIAFGNCQSLYESIKSFILYLFLDLIRVYIGMGLCHW